MNRKHVRLVALFYGAVIGIVGGVVMWITQRYNTSFDALWLMSWIVLPFTPVFIPVAAYVSVLLGMFADNGVALVVSPIILGILFALSAYAQFMLVAFIVRRVAGSLRSRRDRSALPPTDGSMK